ncbi:MAG TPA: SdiA-regulated domain-containing protein, partial [Chitinophagaceae bacterium]
MKFLNFPVRLAYIFLLLSMVVTSCKPRIRKLASPTHYDFSQVLTNTNKLDLKFREISGIAWDSKNNVFLAINDESGKLSFFDKAMHVLPDEPVFGDAGDYEDVAVYNGQAYILRSDGQVTKFVRDSTGKSYGVVAGKIGLSGSNDFETMYADPGRKALVVMCKNCTADDENTVSAFAFYPDSIGFDNKPLFRIDAGEVRKLSPFKTSKLQPSAASINPVTNKLYILSSASSQLVIADTNGKVESVFKLAKKYFPQPEGITFNKNGDMFISNEGPEGKPTIL